jgi:hypothetical protein
MLLWVCKFILFALTLWLTVVIGVISRYVYCIGKLKVKLVRQQTLENYATCKYEMLYTLKILQLNAEGIIVSRGTFIVFFS